MKAVGGEVPATSSLAPKIGPLGLVSILYGNGHMVIIYLIGRPKWLVSILGHGEKKSR